MYTWQIGLIAWLVVWHLMGNIYSIYVHRQIGHGYFIIHPVLEHVFRFWIWFTMSFSWANWQQHWAAKHRKHHKYSDTEHDPHSPYYYTFKQMCDVSHNDPNRANYISPEEVKLYAPEIVSVNDWIERNLYSKYPRLGQQLMWVLFTIFFGWFGFFIGAVAYWGVKVVSIWGGNYANHKWGFKYATKGTSKATIFLPWSIFFGGEEIHAHHHNDASKPYFHRHWWEIDTGWLWCRLFMLLGLMRLRNSTLT